MGWQDEVLSIKDSIKAKQEEQDQGGGEAWMRIWQTKAGAGRVMVQNKAKIRKSEINRILITISEDTLEKLDQQSISSRSNSIEALLVYALDKLKDSEEDLII